jgi:hypothetical protein
MHQRTAFTLYLLAVITYSQNVKPILDLHCVECHTAGSILDLTSFPFTSNTILDQTKIVDKMLAKLDSIPPQMPPGHRPKLSVSEVSTIQQWRDQGLAP